MDSEKDPTPEQDQTDNSNIDPSIDPTKLVVQEGDDTGRIAAVETGDGSAVEGLPVIGAYAEEKVRNEFRSLTGVADQRDMERFADKQGTEAMATEVHNRATELAKKQFPLASPKLIEQFGQIAAEKFKAELESESAQKNADDDRVAAEHEKGVQGLIDSLNSQDTTLAEVIPDVPPYKPVEQLEESTLRSGSSSPDLRM